MLIASDNGFTVFEQGIKRVIVKHLQKHHYEKYDFNSVGMAIVPTAPLSIRHCINIVIIEIHVIIYSRKHVGLSS